MSILTPKKQSYESDIKLGERYVDTQTGYEGVATSITMFQYACERVCLENYDSDRLQVKEMVFDAPRLTHIKTGERATTEKTGGDRGLPGQRGSNAR